MMRNGQIWLDADDRPIQAHGGGVLFYAGVFYWFGENKDTPNIPGTTRVKVIGVNCYSSRDLVQWKDEGIVLRPEVAVLERPKVIYNRQTRKFVMWMHVDSADYTLAHAGVAVSDCVTGPYQFVESSRPNGKESRDLTVFQDDDGRAYLVHSSDWNSSTLIADLTDDYLKPTGYYSRQFDHREKNTGRESPSLFKRAGKYYCITSGCTGWSPNAAECAVADAIHGPWQVIGNPCIGPDAETTFHSQSTFVLPVGDQFIFMGDRWVKDNLRDSRYVWLPVRWRDEQPVIEWQEDWKSI
jgi:beta-xylosidase